ncbi:hypothetical protein AB4254_08615 [Vibrio breoganii]
MYKRFGDDVMEVASHLKDAESREALVRIIRGFKRAVAGDAGNTDLVTEQLQSYTTVQITHAFLGGEAIIDIPSEINIERLLAYIQLRSAELLRVSHFDVRVEHMVHTLIGACKCRVSDGTGQAEKVDIFSSVEKYRTRPTEVRECAKFLSDEALSSCLLNFGN